MKHLFLILILTLSQMAYAHKPFLLKQRAIMEAQLGYEENADLLLLDPDSCKVPVSSQERISALRKNIITLRKKGILTHCPQVRFWGVRRILRQLEAQKKAVRYVETMDAKDTDFSVNASSSVDSVRKTDPLVEIDSSNSETDLDVVTRTITVPPESDDFLKRKSKDCLVTNGRPLPSGYADVYYNNASASPEDFYSLSRTGKCKGSGYDDRYIKYLFHSRTLPLGISLSEGMFWADQKVIPQIMGFPTKPGSYKVNLSAWFWESWGPDYSGNTSIQILPRPKHTVLDPWSKNKFLNLGAPFLSAEMEETARSASGIKSGKIYYEVKVHKLGSDRDAGIGIDASWKDFPSSFISTSGKNRRPGEAQWVLTFNRNVRAFPGQVYVPHKKEVYEDYHGYLTANDPRRPDKEIAEGDVLMVAFDADKGELWFGHNGKWFHPDSDPAAGKFPHIKGISLPPPRTEKYNQNPNVSYHGDYRAILAGKDGTVLTANFGDQPWSYSPPQGFAGMPYTPPASETIANLWDPATASRFTAIEGTKASSKTIYTHGSGGDGVLAQNPKRSGRWQFEFSSFSWPERARMGIVPITFNTHIKQRLGGPGTNGIAAQKRDKLMQSKNVGIVEVNGVPHEIPMLGYSNADLDSNRYTFDCDFDNKVVTIYGDGKELFKTSLPNVPQGTYWAIGATMASVSTTLYTTLESMKYPVPGVKPWGLVAGEQCTNCRTEPEFDDSGIDCQGGWGQCSNSCGEGVQKFLITTNTRDSGKQCDYKDGETRPCTDNACTFCAGTELTADDGSKCAIPDGLLNTEVTCKTAGLPVACVESRSTGAKTFCDYSMDNYSTPERCAQECKTHGKKLKVKCTAGKWVKQ